MTENERFMDDDKLKKAAAVYQLDIPLLRCFWALPGNRVCQ